MEDRAQRFHYLWDGSEPQWALLNVTASNDEPQYLIVNTDSKAAKIIEDDALAHQVIKQMLAAGVRVVSPGNGF